MASMQFKSFGNFNVADFTDYEEQRRKMNEEFLNQQKIQNNMKYKIFNVKDLLTEIQYEGVRKGTKTEVYLENVIESINKTVKYKWIQFFQLVDVFFVVVQDLSASIKNPQEEVRDYVNGEPDEKQSIKGTLSGKNLISADPVSLKTSFPWKDK